MQLLDTWNRGRGLAPGERALLLLAIARPDAPEDVRASWTVGERDAALLGLRRQTFGSRLDAVASCTSCGELLELEFGLDDITFPAQGDPGGGLTVADDGYALTVRPPCSADLAALARGAGGIDPEQWLLERCVLEACRDGTPCAPGEIPKAVLERVAASIAGADAQADVVLHLTCPGCGHEFNAVFDIVAYLWRELEGVGLQLLREVHVLASAFGWSERDILSLPAWRRRSYVEMVGA